MMIEVTKLDKLIDTTITNEVKEVLVDEKEISVVVEFFWDSHGNLVSFPGFNEKNSYSKSKASVKVTKRNYTMLGNNWEDWLLEINGQKIPGSIYRYSYGKNNTLYLKCVVGWG